MILKDGTIVTPHAIGQGDVLIRDGKIADIGPGLDDEGETCIDATGLFVLPGGVDVHTHFDLDVGIARASDDFYTGTVAAAIGGTTTIVDHMGFGPKSCSLTHQLDAYQLIAQGNAVIDYGLHGVLQHVDETVLADLATLCERGVPSVKAYLTYDYRLQDDDIVRVLRRTKALGMLLCVHAENHAAVTALRALHVSRGQTEPIWHARSRPPITEAEAVLRLASLSQAADNAPLYIVHLSSAMGLNAFTMARAQSGSQIFAETCPQYLFLDESQYLHDGVKAICSPPLRDQLSQDALWIALRDGVISTVATDHCPFDFTLKQQLGGQDFTKCPNGLPGVEARMSLLFSAVQQRRLTLQQMVALCSSNPAKLFGLYPQKGLLQVGADADIVLFDPTATHTITHDSLHERCDYTPYEGIPIQGRAVMTIARGQIIAKDGVFLGQKGYGQYLHRKTTEV